MAQKQQAKIDVSQRNGNTVLVLSGEWTILYLGAVEMELDKIVKSSKAELVFDLNTVEKIDTAGRALICRTIRALKQKGLKYSLELHAGYKVEDFESCLGLQELPKPEKPFYFLAVLNTLGEFLAEEGKQICRMVGFLGWVLVLLGRDLIRPWKMRWTSIVSHMDQIGLMAVPIVTLLTFLIGLVIMYMGAQQLSKFGAGVLSINLLEVATFRELGPMLTAIVVAGRSGSAFTAQIGAMVSNDELSAMRVMGFEPMEFLVLPRVIALLFMLPVLTIVSNFAGTAGGAVGAWLILDMNLDDFITQFHKVSNLNNYFAGLAKAPFFAVCIAIIGCFHGMRAKGSAASVGALTTQSVVESIFVVITLDAVFALVYSALGV